MVNFISSGDNTLDELLGGGFQKDLTYLLFGDKRVTSNILLKTAVKAQISLDSSNPSGKTKVVFIDGNNRFNPNKVSKYAVTQKLSPTKVLENIIIACVGTYDQMIELFENRLAKLEHFKMVMVSGINILFQSSEKKTLEEQIQVIEGLNEILIKSAPIFILTHPLSKDTTFNIESDKVPFSSKFVLVLINDGERYIEYILIKHPDLPEDRRLRWKPRNPKRLTLKRTKNATIDCWFNLDDEAH